MKWKCFYAIKNIFFWVNQCNKYLWLFLFQSGWNFPLHSAPCCVAYFVSRGFEFHQQLRRNSFEFLTDADGLEFARLTHETQQKNFQGGLSKDEAPQDRWMYATNVSSCPVALLKLLLAKTDPTAEFLFNSCNKIALTYPSTTEVWFTNMPFSARTYTLSMGDICKQAKPALFTLLTVLELLPHTSSAIWAWRQGISCSCRVTVTRHRWGHTPESPAMVRNGWWVMPPVSTPWTAPNPWLCHRWLLPHPLQPWAWSQILRCTPECPCRLGMRRYGDISIQYRYGGSRYVSWPSAIYLDTTLTFCYRGKSPLCLFFCIWWVFRIRSRKIICVGVV